MQKNITELKGFEFQSSEERQRKLVSSSFEEIPQKSVCHEINGRLRHRFCVSGLIDNVVLSISQNSATLLGLWLAGISLQLKYPVYRLCLVDSESGINEIWCETASGKTDSRKEVFEWKSKDSFEFIDDLSGSKCGKLHFSVTNEKHDWITMDEFYQRNILLGFGGIEQTRQMARTFLNLGSSSELGYVTLKHLEENRIAEIADIDSCEFRIEID